MKLNSPQKQILILAFANLRFVYTIVEIILIREKIYGFDK
jgi:hypothetical protein